MDVAVIQNYERQRREYFEAQLSRISNVTILDSGSNYEHSFCNDCYQKVVKALIEKYKAKSLLSELSGIESMTYATI